MIADGNTPLGCGTSSRRAGTRALPDLHPANAPGFGDAFRAPLDEFGDLRDQLYRKVESTPSGGCLHQLRRPADQSCLGPCSGRSAF